jgi:dTMP kinase
MFITLEGGEGVGKTTQARLLAERLRAAGYPVRLTREPGGTPLANGIRALLLHPDASLHSLADAGLAPEGESAEPMLPITEVLLLSAARAQHVAHIREWLAVGEVVVCDRYADATRVYQGAARGLPLEDIAAAERLATGGLKPDLTLLFDVPVDEGLRRRGKAADGEGGELNRLDRESVAFHERVREGYLALAREETQRWVVIDVSKTIPEVADEIWEHVFRRLDFSVTSGSPSAPTAS